MEKNNLYWHKPSVIMEDRWKANGYRGCLLWFTGLSASGKSTIAHDLCRHLLELGINSYVLDGDNVRHGLNKDLGFSPEHRKENIRRIGEVSKLFIDAGLIIMTAFISPYREDRSNIRKLLKEGEFIEVYVKCSLQECERRDPKGIYKRAKAGEIKEFTGISAPYEEPENPEVILNTDTLSIEACTKKLFGHLVENGYIDAQKYINGTKGHVIEEEKD
ncbi:MAG: adenylyl-sulfate kinase [Nitrospirae bacterium]|nr:adenylyl-sulfate kinase [Nitrospirota bacterium]